jgi:hypothetical protein
MSALSSGETSIWALLDCHNFLSRRGWWGIRRGWEARSHKWFALHFNVVGVLIRSDGVTDLVDDDSVPDVVVPPDVLAGVMK